MIDINHKIMAMGIVQVTAMLANGARRDTCQKLKIIIGRVKVRADSVRTNASRIANVSGRKYKIFLKKS